MLSLSRILLGLLLRLVTARKCTGEEVCVAQDNLLMQKSGVRHIPPVHSDGSIAGNTQVDTSDESWCSYKWKQKIKGGASKTSASWDDKLLLFIQSGPHTGSTLLNEALAGFSNAAPMCRHWKGHHAEVQTQLINKNRSWPNWKKAWKIQEYATLEARHVPADNMSSLQSAVEFLFLHPERKVRILKSPQAVYFTEAFRDAFPKNARFIILVNEPYSYAQHLQQTYFKQAELEESYRTAVHMAADIYMIQMKAAKKANGDALVIRYEDFTEQPAAWLKKIQDFLPELGHVPHFENFKLSIHGRLSKIKNMDNLYLKALSDNHRQMLTQHFREYETAISYFGYKLDEHGKRADTQADF